MNDIIMMNHLEVKRDFAKSEMDMYKEEYIRLMHKLNLDRANAMWSCYMQSKAVYDELNDIIEYLKGLMNNGKSTNK